MGIFRELTLAGTALAATAAIGTAPAQAALVVNGDFETGDFTGWTQGGSTTFDSVTDDAGVVFDGDYSARLGSLTGSTLTQVLDVVAGATYTLTFALANLDKDATNSFSVALGDTTFALPDNFVPFDYGTFTVSTVATGSTLNLAFAFLNEPSYWLLDNVSVEGQNGVPVVPEPTTWAMLLVGFGVVGSTMRRRRKVVAFS
ncbi:PEP-CTERM protein-sorting domain-containing protein [Sphingomonas laterariae]|uniref:PEP-CTERM protein-sorting domain-containing protein n=1 Tax=Edaphosphingomonas laterariae TaxID=861865 RepID=A0A239BLJ1_9SPHN|nr:PEPxxWA-CTERM sorting domain-containing protein [Sphingomonas laterariae]SNS07894.1 PEP-CTERM protein-sorting domain-containing protein [Sphingomonas laterariae]